MTPEQRFWWKIALELKLRKSNGDAFQDFFSVIMAKLHGSDFVRVRAFGALGDKGCDGYLQSSGQVFQCYGALNGAGAKVATLIKKMETDYAMGQQYIVTMNSDIFDRLPWPAGIDKAKVVLGTRLSDQTETGGLFGFRFD